MQTRNSLRTRKIRNNKRIWKKPELTQCKNSYKGNTKIFFEKANDVKNRVKPKSKIMKEDKGEVGTEFKNVFKNTLNISTQIETENLLSQ